MSEFIAGYVADKAIAIGEGLIKKHVIERWARYRAQKFVDTFLGELLDLSKSEVEIQEELEKLFSDEQTTEILFDAYRAVCLTKSKNTGPRVIALLTAELVISNQVSNELDMAVFEAAEQLSDHEFKAFCDYFDTIERQIERNNSSVTRLDGRIRILIDKQQEDSSWPRHEAVSISPLDLNSLLGTWAAKLKVLGLISDDMTQRTWDYQADTESHIDSDGKITEVSWFVTLEPAAEKLAELARRAGANTS